jgi:hypothetical protein
VSLATMDIRVLMKYAYFLDERKQAKLQLVQDTSERNVDNPKNIRHEASSYFRKKRRPI